MLKRLFSFQSSHDFQRRAQFYLDFVEAENSTGFMRRKKRSVSLPNPSTFREKARSLFGISNKGTNGLPFKGFRALGMEGQIVKICIKREWKHTLDDQEPVC